MPLSASRKRIRGGRALRGSRRTKIPRNLKLGNSHVIPSTLPSVSEEKELTDLEEGGDASSAAMGAAGEIQAARECDGIAAALREAEFERLEKENAQAELEALHQEVDMLHGRLKCSQKEIRSLRETVSLNSSAAVDRVALKEECDLLKDELHRCQETLKTAKADSARRARAMQLMQQKLDEENNTTALAAEMEAERSEKASVVSKWQNAKNCIVRKDTVIRELKRKLEESQNALGMHKDAAVHDAHQTPEGRAKQLQAALNRKDALINSLRGKLDELTFETAQTSLKGDDLERHLKSAQHMKQELRKKTTELSGCREELDQVMASL
ncbi:unnamed protein product [Ostreobium quekettii]|uniref:Uncharacterized protein n=1 Tax=Ostreobium quekettii TaxID=121088 RepID=A0A8S1IP73_9CHLO|nr:unnamed protein product [Ostreobium quekettii]